MKLQEGTDADRSMIDITVTSKSIEKLLSNLNPHKAAGPDKIKPIIPKVTWLGNPNYQQSGFMLLRRLSTKKLNTNPANYRPISLTCILCKTLEHIVASSITKHLSKLNLFYELQNGFREKRSCESQLLMLTDDLFKSLYKKNLSHFAWLQQGLW